jgi:hypothetical protein
MIQLTLNALEVRWQRMSVFGGLCADSRGRLCTFWQLAQWQMALAPTAGPTGMSWLAQDTAFETERLGGLLPSAEYLIAPHMQPPVMVVDIVTVFRTIEYLVSGLRSRLGAESVDEIGGLGWMYDLFVVEGRYIYIHQVRYTFTWTKDRLGPLSSATKDVFPIRTGSMSCLGVYF